MHSECLPHITNLNRLPVTVYIKTVPVVTVVRCIFDSATLKSAGTFRIINHLLIFLTEEFRKLSLVFLRKRHVSNQIHYRCIFVDTVTFICDRV